MTNLTAIQPTNDVSVNLATGEAFISIRRLAKELGIHHSSLNKHLSSRHPNLMFSKGIPPEIMQQAAKHYAFKSQAANSQAESFYDMLCEAGAKAYLYREAGLSIGVNQQRPLSQLEAYEELVRMEKTRLALLDTVGAQAKVITMQTEIIETKQVETDSSTESFTIRRIRLLNQGMKIDPKVLLKVCKELNLEPEQVFDLYPQLANSYPREVWEEAYPDAILP